MKIAYLFLVFISLVLFSSCSKESATIVSPSNAPYDRTIFVDPVNGNDLNTGREVTLPVKTLFKAVSKAINGDTIYVRGGVYTSFKEVIIKTGTDLGYIFLRPYPGESVVFDGTGGTYAENEAILTIKNSIFIDISGFEIRNNLSGSGINILSESKYCNFISIRNCSINNIFAAGIYVGSSNFTLENCQIFNTCLSNRNRALGDAGKWHSAIETYFKYNYLPYSTSEFIWESAFINNNKIYNNWGEGIKLTRSNIFKISNNQIYNCYNGGIVMDNSRNGIVFNNFIYTTGDEYNRVTSGYSRPMHGVIISNEKNEFSANPVSENLAVYNNLIVRTSAPFRWYYDVNNTSPWNTYKGIKILFNTTYNTIGKETFALDTDFGLRNPPSNNEFKNNIIYKPNYNSVPQNYLTTSADYSQYWAISNNCFSSGDIPAFLAKGNISGNPAFVNPSLQSPDGFKISTGSVCYETGVKIASITNDFFLNARLETPSIGFYELRR